MIAITHRIIQGNAYEGKTKFLYPFDKINLDIYLANTATSITRKDTADLSDPNCRLHYVAAIASKAFYDHARFYAGADYDSGAWQILKYCDHDIYLVKECEGDGEVYAVASSQLVPFIVIGKLVRDCVIRLKFESAVAKFKV